MLTIQGRNLNVCPRHQIRLPCLIQNRRRWFLEQYSIIRCQVSQVDRSVPEDSVELVVKKQTTAKLYYSQSPKVILQILNQQQDYFDPIHIGAAAVRLAYLIPVTSFADIVEGYNQFIAIIEQRMDDLSGRQLVNCLWSLGMASQDPRIFIKIPKFKEIFERLAISATTKRQDLNVIEITSAIWAISKTKISKDWYIHLLASRCAQIGENMQAQYHSFDGQTIINQTKFDAHYISTVVWGLGVLYYSDAEVIARLANIVRQSITKANGTNVAFIAYGLKRLRYYDEHVLDQIEYKILNNTQLNFTGDDISMISLAFADFGVGNQETLDCLVYQLLATQIGHINVYVNVIYSLSILNYSVDTVQTIIDRFVEQIDNEYGNLKKIELIQLGRACMEFESRGANLNFPLELKELFLEVTRKSNKRQFQPCVRIKREIVEKLSEKSREPSRL
eukprot:TRINITY_DN23911_c0_g2_i2.p1 TRINITY_DN23911_c0_g2~~TRINITY_DN23911_c0_g2_i2.p1  ORF type:complete len:448 (-),score=15.65 TRINITY_DN23911_c0_g2_i2:59-1402(-)